MAPRNGGATVFVGNINYDATEDQLRDIFSQVGTVVNFRVVYDQESGRPKGYGFCEYEDAETAMSARRNLNGYELNGRQLRVDFTESDKSANAASGGAASGNVGAGRGSASAQGSKLQLPDALSGPNPSLAVLSLPQIHEVMLQLKKAVNDYSLETRDLFMKNPQLCHAVLQGLIMLGLMPLPPIPPQGQGPGSGVGRVPNMSQPAMPQSGVPQPGMTQSGMLQPGIPQSQIPQPGMPQPGMPQPGMPQVVMPQPGMHQTGIPVGGGLSIPVGGRMPGHGQQQGQQQGAPMHAMPHGMPGMPPPLQGGGSHGQPPMNIHMPPMPGIPQGHSNAHQQPLMEQQAALLKQVMELTPEQIEQLPPEQRSQVLQLQALAGAGAGHLGGAGPGVGAGVGGPPGRGPYM